MLDDTELHKITCCIVVDRKDMCTSALRACVRREGVGGSIGLLGTFAEEVQTSEMKMKCRMHASTKILIHDLVICISQTDQLTDLRLHGVELVEDHVLPASLNLFAQIRMGKRRACQSRGRRNAKHAALLVQALQACCRCQSLPGPPPGQTQRPHVRCRPRPAARSQDRLRKGHRQG